MSFPANEILFFLNFQAAKKNSVSEIDEIDEQLFSKALTAVNPFYFLLLWTVTRLVERRYASLECCRQLLKGTCTNKKHLLGDKKLFRSDQIFY